MSKYFRLNSNHSCIIFKTSRSKFPEIIYWGTKLKKTTSDNEVVFSALKPLIPAEMDNVFPLQSNSIMPLPAKGFWGAPAMEGNRQGKDWSPDFQIIRIDHNTHQITFVFEALDAELALSVHYQLDPVTDVLESKAILTNQSKLSYQLDWLSAGTFPVSPILEKVISFHGSWSNEFQTQTHLLRKHAFLQENRTGRTSLTDFPGLILEEKHTTEHQGLSYGFHLAWSGNHKLLVEPITRGEAQIQLGERFFSGECLLEKGETYQTPSVYASFSNSGRTQLSQNFHQFLRTKILPKSITSKQRPVQLNTWEALYFDHDIPTLQQMASTASELGFERFVLDDGWFQGRNDATAGLGDWFPDQKKYPDGLTPLVDYIEAKGMEFGLWVEPEMVNPESQLYRDHPDWVLHLKNQPKIEARNQLALNLNLPDVSEYLFNCLDTLLKDYHIGYLKWDMNRDLIMAGDGYHPQYHQQVVSYYRLIDRLRRAYPDVEIETCASGGGRIDFEILKRTERFWTSDNNDALKRISIQRGCSYFFPLEVMGSHIGPEECHITKRRSRLSFRAHIALFGHFGAEFDLRQISNDQKLELKFWVDFFKQKRELLHQGNLIRLETNDSGRTVQGVVSHNQNEAIYVIYQTDVPNPKIPAQVYFKGLNPDQEYCVKLIGFKSTDPSFKFIPNLEQWMVQGLTMQGDQLENIGLWLQLSLPETSLVITLTAK
jgi:alpha-galactosidase